MLYVYFLLSLFLDLIHTIYIYIYIYSSNPVGLSSLATEVIVLPLAYMQGSSYKNCDS